MYNNMKLDSSIYDVSQFDLCCQI